MQRPPLTAYETTRDQGTVSDQDLTYDLTRIGQTSIYVFHAPDTGK